MNLSLLLMLSVYLVSIYYRVLWGIGLVRLIAVVSLGDKSHSSICASVTQHCGKATFRV